MLYFLDQLKSPNLLFVIENGAVGIQKKDAMRSCAAYLTPCVQHGTSQGASLHLRKREEACSTCAPIISGLGKRAWPRFNAKLSLIYGPPPPSLRARAPRALWCELKANTEKNTENY